MIDKTELLLLVSYLKKLYCGTKDGVKKRLSKGLILRIVLPK